MKTLIKKILSVSVIAFATLISVGSASAWGPSRTTFTNEVPATYNTMNSITDNASIGDERNFVRVRESGTDDTYVDSVDIEPGKTYDVIIYYHNNAASNYNLTATNTRVYAYFPGVISGSSTGEVGATISADNTNPSAVWDEADFYNTSSVGVTLAYVEGSATIHNNNGAAIDGMSLPEADLFSEPGALIGYDALDGNLPGCAQYSGYITYQVEVKQAAVSLSKMVSKDGVNYYDNITDVQIGDTVYYKVLAKNVGTKEISNVVAYDRLTTGLLSNDDAHLVDTATGGEKVSYDLNGFFTVGQTAIVNNLSVGGEGWTITYSATVTEEALAGAECGEAKLVNTVYIDYSIEGGTAGTLGNQAAVFVNKECETTPEEPEEPDEPEIPEELPNTGPVEIVLAVVVVAGIGGGGYYLYRTRRKLKTVENSVTGKGTQGNDESVVNAADANAANMNGTNAADVAKSSDENVAPKVNENEQKNNGGSAA